MIDMSISYDEAVLYDAGYIKGAVEAVLFASGGAVEEKKLAEAIGVPLSDVTACINELQNEYNNIRGIEIIRVGSKYQMRTNPVFYHPINALMTLPEKKTLTSVLLETLAIIAFKQPVTKSVIEDIRGLSADHAVNRLVEMDLVRECGRLDAPGRPMLFETTDEFLRRFGISSLDELDKITELALIQTVNLAKAGADVIHIGDDIGTQHGIMMSEGMYCEWIKPRLKRIIDSIKAVDPEILIHYHSCGFVTPFIPHLIECGIDVLNPVQPECMDFKEIHDMYGDVLSFNGTLGTQTTMPFGTPDDVRRTVFTNLDIAGEKGGLIAAPTHLLEPEVPVENVLAYLKACNDYKF